MTTNSNHTIAQLDKSGNIIRVWVGQENPNNDEVTLDLAAGQVAKVGDHVTVDEDGIGTID